MIRAKITVSLKEDVMDPQGNAVSRALHTLGHSSVKSVRVGRYFDLVLDVEDEESALTEANAICEALLANLVIENYQVAIEPLKSAEAAETPA
jgi:phosphoribosylformylglycinamidine synthase